MELHTWCIPPTHHTGASWNVTPSAFYVHSISGALYKFTWGTVDGANRIARANCAGKRKLKKTKIFYSILNFNSLKIYAREKRRHYLDIFSLGRHGCHIVQKLKFAHHFPKFKIHAVSKGRKEGKQEKHRW